MVNVPMEQFLLPQFPFLNPQDTELFLGKTKAEFRINDVQMGTCLNEMIYLIVQQ